MLKSIILNRILFYIAMSCILLSAVGCACIFRSNIPCGPHVAGDNTGGAIIFYEAVKSKDERNFCIQKTDAAGNALWGERILIDTSYSEFNNYWTLKIAGDGMGGAFIAWYTQSEPGEGVFPDHYLARIDSGGRLTWQKNMGAIKEIISDGHYGAFVIIQEYGDSLSLNKIDKEGNYLWREAISLSRSSYSPICLAADISGGLIVYEELAATLNSMDMRIRRLGSDGNWLGDEHGIKLTLGPMENSAPHNPAIISCDNDTFIVVWSDVRHGLASLYAQKFDYTRAIKWHPQGMKVCYAGTNASFWPVNLVSDDLGGAVVTWSYKKADTGQKILRAQKLDTQGRALWGEDGVVVLESPHSAHSLAYDGMGGAIIGWGTESTFFKPSQSYIQRLDAEGKQLWNVRLNY